jgi:organic hydroperoxide reductase OsmC/OhrA
VTDDPHEYGAVVTWRGSTASGYDSYDRTHAGACPPAAASLTLSADPAFLGDAAILNPEQLLVLAAASCQLLSFLAVAARAHIDVWEYDDDAEATMPEEPRPMRIREIRLQPRIRVAPGTDAARVLQLCEVAHKECFIANTLACPVTVDAAVRVADDSDVARHDRST